MTVERAPPTPLSSWPSSGALGHTRGLTSKPGSWDFPGNPPRPSLRTLRGHWFEPSTAHEKGPAKRGVFRLLVGHRNGTPCYHQPADGSGRGSVAASQACGGA